MTPTMKRLAIGLALLVTAICALYACTRHPEKPATKAALQAAQADVAFQKVVVTATSSGLRKRAKLMEGLNEKLKAETAAYNGIVYEEPTAKAWADQPVPPAVADWLYHTPNEVRGSDAGLYVTESVSRDSD